VKKNFQPVSGREVFEELSRLNGREALEFTHRTIANLFRAAFDDLPRVLHETRADALVLDGVMIELGLVPTHLGVPYVHVSNALHYDFSGWTPIFAFDWPHETTPEAIARNKEGVRAYLKLLESNKLIARAYAERVGLNFDSNNPLEGISKLAWISQTT
jgi:zeaxanthin glucosyltransferase